MSIKPDPLPPHHESPPSPATNGVYRDIDPPPSLNEYTQVMGQVDYPDGVKSKRPIVCTQEKADEMIDQLCAENPAWRIVEMRFVRERQFKKWCNLV